MSSNATEEKPESKEESEEKSEAKKKPKKSEPRFSCFKLSLRTIQDSDSDEEKAKYTTREDVLQKLKQHTERSGIDAWSVCEHDKCSYTEYEHDAYTDRIDGCSDDEIKKETEKAAKNGDLDKLLAEPAKANELPIEAQKKLLKDADKARIGKKKHNHVHIAILMKPGHSARIQSVASWFGIEKNYVQKATEYGKSRGGKKAFLQLTEYFTHTDDKSRELHKHEYSDDEVLTSENYQNWRALVEEEKAKVRLLGNDYSEADWIKVQVASRGMTIEEVRENHIAVYIKYQRQLERLRKAYITDVMPMPKWRENYYISGPSGSGKSWLALAIARSIWLRTHDTDILPSDESIFYIVGQKNCSFDSYDGQPIIVWDDIRPVDLLSRFGFDRGEFFKQIDKSPKKAQVNIKYGSVVLKNTVNIFTCVMDWKDWVKGLASQYIDKDGNEHTAEDDQIAQILRRLDAFIVLHSEDYDFGLNVGLLDSVYDPNNAFLCMRMPGPVAKFAQLINNNQKQSAAFYDRETKGIQDLKAKMPSSNEFRRSKESEESGRSLDEIYAIVESSGKQNPERSELSLDLAKKQADEITTKAYEHIHKEVDIKERVWTDGISTDSSSNSTNSIMPDYDYDPENDRPLDFSHLSDYGF